MAEHEIWLVTIELPIKYINRGLEQGDEIIQKDIEDTNAELADAFGDEPEEAMPTEPTDATAGGQPEDITPEGQI